MSVTVITAENFKKEVLESDKPVLVDFWASWCGPCRMLAPVMEEIAEENDGVKVGKLNVDEYPELAAQFSIDSIPAVLAFNNSVLIGKSVGYRPKEDILSIIAG